MHRQVLLRVLGGAAARGLGMRGLMPSPLRGPAGNVEFLGWWVLGDKGTPVTAAVAACMAEIEAGR